MTIYYGESQDENIYSRPDDVCQELLTEWSIFRNLNFILEFCLQKLHLRFDRHCDWQHLEKLEISWFHFSEQSFGMPPIVPNFTRL